MVLIAIMLAVFAILLIQVLRLLQERQPLPSLSSLGSDGSDRTLGTVHKGRHLHFEIFDPSLPLVTLFIILAYKVMSPLGDPLPPPSEVTSFMDAP